MYDELVMLRDRDSVAAKAIVDRLVKTTKDWSRTAQDYEDACEEFASKLEEPIVQPDKVAPVTTWLLLPKLRLWSM